MSSYQAEVVTHFVARCGLMLVPFVESDRLVRDHGHRLNRSDIIHILKSGRERSDQLPGTLAAPAPKWFRRLLDETVRTEWVVLDAEPPN